MALSNTATPIYYGRFREAVMRGEIPVCREISMEMNRIDDLIANPGIYYDDKAINGFIAFCEDELTLTDGGDVKMLDSFNGKDQMVAPAILGAAGNCYAQLGQLDKAASTLLSAADKADNNTLSPIFLIQAGEILVKQGKYDDAVNAYTKIKDKYFQSYQAMDIDKYIEQAKLMKK